MADSPRMSASVRASSPRLTTTSRKTLRKADPTKLGPEFSPYQQPDANWIVEVLKVHNRYRARHHVPPLVWNEEGFDFARRQADTCMERGKAVHGFTDCLSGIMGQNLCGPLKGSLQLNIKWDENDVKKVVDLWYGEAANYKYDEPALKRGRWRFENFAQLIWFGTTSVGMAISRDGRYCVANYFPAGLQVAYLAENIPPPQEGKVPWEASDPLPLPPAPDYTHLLYEGGFENEVAAEEVVEQAEELEEQPDAAPEKKNKSKKNASAKKEAKPRSQSPKAQKKKAGN